MSARPFGCNLIRRPNAGGRTLLENWVEERATKQFDENADRQQIQRKGHSNIVSRSFNFKFYENFFEFFFSKIFEKFTKIHHHFNYISKKYRLEL